ncbi:glutathione S-transferase family protein [Archangium violaceum]|uniref:glutathione binding-like protein n=1 Tax=Archangium violaceum TaxID=83451 RepID=UPI00194F5534|nr:glutathione binding-like protein [Archangium violaceum]QRO00700.1 glutathione S-transferase family protein [Archangium violaceum]
MPRGLCAVPLADRCLGCHARYRRWLVGEAVTLADYAVAAPLMYREQARLPLGDYPHLLAWFDRVRELSAWRNSEAVS